MPARQNGNPQILLGNADERRQLFGVEEDVPVIQHYPLGSAGGAGCVDNGGQIFLGDFRYHAIKAVEMIVAEGAIFENVVISVEAAEQGMFVVTLDDKNGFDFFEYEPPTDIDYIISNPPYSIKFEVFSY